MKSIKVKEGDMVRFKHSEEHYLCRKFGGKIGLALKVVHDSHFDLLVGRELIDVDVFIDGRIVNISHGYLDKVENI